MSPVEGFVRLEWAVVLGAAVGAWYDFLKPVRPRWLEDTLLSAGRFVAWVYLFFPICQGDLRLWILAGMIPGFFLWEKSAGRLLTPISLRFWKMVGQCGALALLPVKKFLGILKKLLASGMTADDILENLK